MLLDRKVLLKNGIINSKAEIINIAFFSMEHIPYPEDQLRFKIATEINNRIQVCIRINRMNSAIGSELSINVEPYYLFLRTINEGKALNSQDLKSFFESEKALEQYADSVYKLIDFDKLYWSSSFELLALGVPFNEVFDYEHSAGREEINDAVFEVRYDFYKDRITYQNFLKKTNEIIIPLMVK